MHTHNMQAHTSQSCYNQHPKEGFIKNIYVKMNLENIYIYILTSWFRFIIRHNILKNVRYDVMVRMENNAK